MNFASEDVEAYKHGAAYVSGQDLVVKKAKTLNNYDISNLRLKGSFNKQNLMAASFIAKKYGASNEAIDFVINNFAGIEHRLELVQNKNSVCFYNDARVSTVKGLMRSLNSFPKPVVLIAGGKDNGENYEDLCSCIQKNVKTLILMGESKERMNRCVGDSTETFVVGTFEEAVVLAYQKSKRGDVILYSPGCSPMDAWSKIEDRGKRYKEIIKTF